jgi:hypothetical protein
MIGQWQLDMMKKHHISNVPLTGLTMTKGTALKIAVGQMRKPRITTNQIQKGALSDERYSAH